MQIYPSIGVYTAGMARRFLGKYDAKKGQWLKNGKHFALLLLIVFLIFRFLIGVSWVSGESMYPTLNNGAAVVYLRPVHNYQVGDIVSVRMAYGEYYIKRVAAVAGDRVELRDGVCYINGQPESGSWVCGRTEDQQSTVSYPLTVPAGRVFVMGDNREGSVDSRTFGCISASQTRGRILFHIG